MFYAEGRMYGTLFPTSQAFRPPLDPSLQPTPESAYLVTGPSPARLLFLIFAVTFTCGSTSSATSYRMAKPSTIATSEGLSLYSSSNHTANCVVARCTASWRELAMPRAITYSSFSARGPTDLP